MNRFILDISPVGRIVCALLFLLFILSAGFTIIFPKGDFEKLVPESQPQSQNLIQR